MSSIGPNNFPIESGSNAHLKSVYTKLQHYWLNASEFLEQRSPKYREMKDPKKLQEPASDKDRDALISFIQNQCYLWDALLTNISTDTDSSQSSYSSAPSSPPRPQKSNSFTHKSAGTLIAGNTVFSALLEQQQLHHSSGSSKHSGRRRSSTVSSRH